MSIAMEAKKYRIVECPICYEYLRPPVTTCKNGHGICPDCKKVSQRCGICREDFTDLKNTLLDQMVESLLVKCSSEGCQECLPANIIKDHEKLCFYRKVECYICHVKNIYLPELSNHFKNHDCRYQCNLTFCSSYCMPLDVHKWNDNANLYFVLHITNIQTYFLLRFYYRLKKTLYFCVQYIGENQADAKKYKYDIKIDQGLGPYDQSFFMCTGLCLPYTCDYEDVKNTENVMLLDLQSIFLTKNYLSKGFNFEIEIKRRYSS